MKAIFRAHTLAVAGLAALLALLVSAGPARTDQAPFWQSPAGLAPGYPGTRVAMLAEVVNIRVIERDQAVYAVVDATFDMLNRGPNVRMKVGFPSEISSLLQEASGDPHTPYSPALFSPSRLTEFRVWTDDAEYFPSEQRLNHGVNDRYGTNWFVWEMEYPSGTPVRVYVSYEQRLDQDGQCQHDACYVQPMYVLRTGALWDGTIGEATITLTAPGGGALLGGPELFAARDDAGELITTPDRDTVLGAAQAAEASEARIVWRLSDFEPGSDVGATYIFADAWPAIRDGEAAIASGSASTDDYVRATQAVLRIIGRWGPHRVPAAIVERYPALAREWAGRSVEAAPEMAAAWEAVGDMERWFAMPPRKHHGELDCWPIEGVNAYRRALALGSPTAEAKLESLFEASDWGFDWYSSPIGACGPPTDDETLVTANIRRVIRGGNSVWADGVDRNGTSAAYDHFFADAWLGALTEEVRALRRLGWYRDAHLDELRFRSIGITASDAAVAETEERWTDRTYRADGTLARDASGRLWQRWELRLRDGGWKVIDATVVRDTPPVEYPEVGASDGPGSVSRTGADR